MKIKIYTRVFCGFLAIFVLIISVFLMYYVNIHKDMEIRGFVEKAKIISQSTDLFYEEYTGYLKGEKDITSEDIYSATMGAMFYNMDFVIYDSEGESIWENSLDKWYCSYDVPTHANEWTGTNGLVVPEKCFSEEQINEIEEYMNYSNPDAEMWELASYHVNINGIWTDGLYVFPESLEIYAMKVAGKNNEGQISSQSGSLLKVIESNIDTEKLSDEYKYFESGSMNYRDTYAYYNHKNSSSIEKATEYANSKEIYYKAMAHKQNFGSSVYNEKTGFLSYMFVYLNPYGGIWDVREDDSLTAEAVTMYAGEIDLWELYGTQILMIFFGCLAVFIAAAWITAAQSYRIYLEREKNEENRIRITNALAHDLKTPLSAIMGYSDLIAENLNEEKKDHYVGMIKENANTMDSTLKQMLELSRIESLGTKMNKTEFGLGQLTKEVEELFEATALLKGVKINIDGDQILTADRTMIKSAVDNLISNAVKYSDQDSKIEVTITENSWSVFNRGFGIPEEEAEKIWEPYYKSDDSRSRFEGTGLGLYIVKTVMDAHGFKYSFKNNDGGVVFEFTFKK